MAQARVLPGNAGRNDYPKMLYHPDGRTIGVETPQEHDTLAREGWELEPQPAHLVRPSNPSPVMSGGDPLGVLLREVVEAVLLDFGFERKGAK